MRAFRAKCTAATILLGACSSGDLAAPKEPDPPAPATENHAPTIQSPDNVVWIRAGSGDVVTGNLLDYATDEDGNALTIVVETQPVGGTLDVEADGSYTYTPRLNYMGPDGLRFRVTDGMAESNLGGIDFHVDAVPVAKPDTFHVAAGEALVVPAPGLLGNDVDLNDPILDMFPVSDPSHGTLVSWGYTGEFTYVPAPGFTGIDEFEYRASENNGSLSKESEPAKVIIIVE